jgi:hypothetical protein
VDVAISVDGKRRGGKVPAELVATCLAEMALPKEGRAEEEPRTPSAAALCRIEV